MTEPTGGRKPRKPGPVKVDPVDPPRPTAKPKEITTQAEDHCPNCFRWSTWNGSSCSAPDCNATSTAKKPSGPVLSGKSNSYVVEHLASIKREQTDARRERRRTVVNKIIRFFKNWR